MSTSGTGTLTLMLRGGGSDDRSTFNRVAGGAATAMSRGVAWRWRPAAVGRGLSGAGA